MDIAEMKRMIDCFAYYLWNISDYELKVEINKRLKRTIAQVYYNKKTIEVSVYLLNSCKYVVASILLHEMCHFYCHKNGIEDRDGFSSFEKLCSELGSTSSGLCLKVENKIKFFQCECELDCNIKHIKRNCFKEPNSKIINIYNFYDTYKHKLDKI